jgi:hypothetical protein
MTAAQLLCVAIGYLAGMATVILLAPCFHRRPRRNYGTFRTP